MSIREIDIRHAREAAAVWNVQQPAYRIEAELIGFADLPPLRETVEQLQACGETFYGFFEGDELRGAISCEREEEHVRICRMVVHPEHFRKGIAGRLLRHLLSNHPAPKTVVTTGAANTPAINLYLAHGFNRTRNERVGPGLELTWLEK